MKKFYLSLALSVVAIGLYAYTPATEGERIIVTADRIGEKEKKIPVKVTVITKEEIQNSGAENLAQVLNQKSFAFVKEQPGMLGNVYMNGSKSNENSSFISSRVLILVNGHSAGTGLIDNIPLSAIEKIEWIEGPISSVYGAGGLAGVVNIITEKKAKNHIKASFETGSYEYSKGEFLAAFNPEKVISIVFGGGQGKKGEYKTGKDHQKYLNTKYKQNFFYFAFNLPLYQKAYLEGSFQYFDADPVGSPNTILSNDKDDSIKISRNSGDLTFFSPLARSFDFSATAYINQYQRTFNGIDPLYPSYNKTKVFELGLNPFFIYQIESYKLQFGLNSNYSKFQNEIGNGLYSEPNSRYFIGGFFIDNQLNILKSLNLNFGARYDYYSSELTKANGITFNSSDRKKDFDHFSIKGGLAYNYENFVIKAYTGTGFRAPTIMELTGNYTGSWGSYQGNPDLKPEKSIGFQSSFGYDAVHKLIFTYQYQEIKDRIASKSFGTYPSNYTSYVNQKSARIQSVEAEAVFNWASLLKIKDLSGQVTLKGIYYLEYKDEENNKNLYYIPEKKIMARLETGIYQLLTFYADLIWMGEINDIHFNPVTYAQTDSNIGNYTLMNAGINLTPFIIFAGDQSHLKGLSFSFKVNNILDQNYAYVDSYPMPGREYKFGASYEYKF